MDVTMPQLGETVTEGTITRWFKQVGDQVAADEPLFEVSTDKVDSEVPAPSAGVLTEILVPEGETVEVGARLAVIGDGAAAPSAPAAAAAPEPPAPEPPAPSEPAAAPEPAPAPDPVVAAPAPPAPPAPATPPPAAPATAVAPAGGGATGGALTSPLVRRLAAEYGLDPATIPGTGEGGRVTRNDVLRVARETGATSAPPPARAPAAPAPAPAAPGAPAPTPAQGDEVVPFDNMRRRTAEHMVRSKATSAHVYTSVRVDFERVERARREHRDEWKAEEGFSLTYLPFLVRAISDVVHEYPHVNASVDGDTLIVHRDVHLGIAVDLDFNGLLAPVVRNVDGKRLRLIAREIRDLATRAKQKALRPDEVVGGTFTITNMGPFGTTMTLPIINQPQVAILATDAVTKEPVVIEGPDGEDTIAIHHVGYLSLAWDHRAFDGAYAASFLAAVREVLETRDWTAELA
ncbi:MAG TPA: dihydrolipoamide acetyltransferase family protein [Acidimicrobiia bacterium]|nr:dihydrolipoamide acetyltransferase family protein [Acidimicrobiia bacterium]